MDNILRQIDIDESLVYSTRKTSTARRTGKSFWTYSKNCRVTKRYAAAIRIPCGYAAQTSGLFR